MSLYALDDSPYELGPHPREVVCDECGELAEEELDGLCERCRCWDCGEVNAPVERDEQRFCRPCAFDRNIFGPLFLQAAE